MRINELENRTGLERATIRFYEKEALISPQRSENGYRLYTQADADELMKIKLLRQLGMSLDQIRALQQGSGEISAVLETQAEVLSRQIDSKRQALEVCHEIRAAGATYRNLDADYYLARLRQAPKAVPSRQTSPAQPTFRESVPKEVHPVRRAVGRLLDISILSSVVCFLLFFVLRLRPVPTGIGAAFLNYAIWLLELPYEAILLRFLGTTPGKWIMGIRLEAYFGGGNLSFSQALSRAWRAFSRGMGFVVIRIYTAWRLYKSYGEYMQTGDAEWDDETEVFYSPWNGKRKAILVLVVCVVLTVALVTGWDSVLPPNRAEQLTVAEFAENYNFYLSLLDGTTDRTKRLTSDGTKDSGPGNVVHVQIGGNQVEENPEFTFETKDGCISRITYQCSWTDIFYMNTGLGEHYIAAVTAALSQTGMEYGDLKEFTDKWEGAITASDSGEFTYGDITLRWNIETQNCRNESGRYQTIDEDLPSSVCLDFEIIYN